jgi:hypothetical protein
MPLMFRKRTCAILTEGTYGTFESLAAGNVHRFHQADLDYVRTIAPVPKSDGTLGSDVGPPGAKYATLNLKNYQRGDGGTGDPAWAASLYPSVGMPSNTTNSYQTSSTTTSWKGLSGAINRDGKRRSIRGAMGNLKMNFTAGDPIENEWSFIGGYNANATDTAQLTGITYEEVTAPIFAKASAFTMDGSTAFKISKATLDLRTSPFARPDPNATGGYIGGWLENILPMITMDPEAVTVATKDWDAYLDAGTTFTVVFAAGTVTGNIVTTTCTLCQLTGPAKDQERNGVLVDALGMQVNGTVTTVYS